jgi:ketosteroid isomerase-like protein
MTSAVDTVKSLYAGFASGDVGAVLGALDPAIEWDGFAAVPSEFVCQGDTVVAIGEYSGTFKATGKHFRTPFVHVWRSRGGALVNFRQHTDTAIVQAALR